MELKFKKLHPDATLPSYAKKGDAGLDLTCINIDHNREKRYWTYYTGLAVEIPEGFVGLVFPRSSIRNTKFRLSNSVGVVDSGYRGEIVITFKVDTGDLFAGSACAEYNVGEKVAQLLIIPYPTIEPVEVTELSESERGESGFGSSDKK